MSAPTVTADRYPLGRSDAETERLILQHQIYGPFTRRFLRDAGIGAGMQVLDLGSGAGDVALVLADLVGPQGRVVGLDMNPDLLARAAHRIEAAGWRNVTFRGADLERLDDAGLDGNFDAVVGRWVLMFLSDPADLLRRLRARLRPGGTVAFLESDLTTPVRAHPPAPLHDRLSRLLAADDPGAASAGPEGRMGLELVRTFLDAGLPVPRLEAHAPAGGGPDWPGYAYVAACVRSLAPHLERARGVRPEELGLDLDTLDSRLRDEIVGGRGMQILATVIGAWART